jgi:hypothetical protein
MLFFLRKLLNYELESKFNFTPFTTVKTTQKTTKPTTALLLRRTAEAKISKR